MINPSHNFRRIILGDSQRSEIRNIALKYPFREVAGFVVGEVKKKAILAKDIIFGDVSRWKRHYFEIQVDLSGEILNPANPDRIHCLFHSHPNGNLFPTVRDVQSMIVTKIPWLIFSVLNDDIKFKGYIVENGVIRKIDVTNFQAK